jgi:glycosyltransferase involved in cell wall biosynthesis
MKLIYLTSLFYPSTIANNRQTLSMAKAFSSFLGDDFLFVISHTANRNLLSGINFYETKVRLLRKFHLVAIYYFFWLPLFIKRFKSENVVLYFKDSKLASIAIKLRKWLHFKYKIAFESHLIYENWRDGYIYQNADYVLPITSKLKRIISEKFNANSTKILVVPDGVDMDIFNIPDRKEEYKKELNLPLNKKIVGYVGTFSTMGMEKGVKDLIIAFAIIKKRIKNVFLIMAGGKDQTDLYNKFAIDAGLTKGEDFTIEKYVDYSLVPKYLKACDVLVSAFPFNKHFAYYMSPLRIFEYMASKRPIITSDLPAIREVLNESEAVFFEPGNINDLSEKIKLVLDNPENFQRQADAAFEKVKNYTWDKRAKNILQSIK